MVFDQAPHPEGKIFAKLDCSEQLAKATSLQDMYEVLRSYQYVVGDRGEVIEVASLIETLEKVAPAILNLKSNEEFVQNYGIYRQAITDNGGIFTHYIRLLGEMTGRVFEIPSA